MKSFNIRIGETLRFFRNIRGFTQKEMLKSSADHTVPSRIENGKRDVKLKELDEILDTLSVNINEFITFSNFDSKQEIFRKEFYATAMDIDNPEKKAEMLQYYNSLVSATNRTSIQLSNLASTKAYFSQFWSEIESVTAAEIQEAYNLLVGTKYLLQYDYALIANMIHQFPAEQRKKIMEKAFPIADQHLRDLETLKHAYNTIPNAITACLQEKQYDEAKKYVELADTIDKAGRNVYHIMNINYLGNLIDFVVTGDRKYQKKINRYIDILHENGFTSMAKDSDEEVKRFTFGDVNKDDMPINTF